MLYATPVCSQTIHYETKCTLLTCILQSHFLPFYQSELFIKGAEHLKVITAIRCMKKWWSMAILIGCDISSEIPTSSKQCTYFPEREVFSSYLIHLAYANECLNLVRGRVMWEIGESTILFTLMGNVFSPVYQCGGSFSHAGSRNEEANRTWIWPQHKKTFCVWKWIQSGSENILKCIYYCIYYLEHIALYFLLSWRCVFSSIFKVEYSKFNK